MTSLGYYPDWEDDDDWSGYTPPNSELLRHVGDTEGLPAPVYEPGPATWTVDWAAIIVELAVDRYGGENGPWRTTYNNGPWCTAMSMNRCECGVLWVGDQPCWYCHPQPAPRLIVPRCPGRALP